VYKPGSKPSQHLAGKNFSIWTSRPCFLYSASNLWRHLLSTNSTLSAVQTPITVNITPYTLITIVISFRITFFFVSYLPILACNSLPVLIIIALKDVINYYNITILRIRAVESYTTSVATPEICKKNFKNFALLQPSLYPHYFSF